MVSDFVVSTVLSPSDAASETTYAPLMSGRLVVVSLSIVPASETTQH